MWGRFGVGAVFPEAAVWVSRAKSAALAKNGGVGALPTALAAALAWAAKNGGVGALPEVGTWGGVGVGNLPVFFFGYIPRKRGRAAESAALKAVAWAACPRRGQLVLGVGRLPLAWAAFPWRGRIACVFSGCIPRRRRRAAERPASAAVAWAACPWRRERAAERAASVAAAWADLPFR